MDATRTPRTYRGRMKTIRVRNVPDEIYAVLEARAAAAGISVSDYVLHELGQVAQRSANAEALSRAAPRAWSVPRATTREVLDEVRVGR